MQIGTLFAFLSYLMQILMGVMMATFMVVMIPRAAVCADRIGEVLDDRDLGAACRSTASPSCTATAPSSSSTSTSPTRAPSSRCCATSRFPRSAGQTTAIIGSTGAGKTTLVDLLPRLFDVTGGAVLVDGVDVRELDPDVLWSASASCRRSRTCSPAPSRSNLRYGKPDATDDELWQALEIAQATRLRRGDGRAASTRRSPRAARTSPAGSASGSRSPGRS